MKDYEDLRAEQRRVIDNAMLTAYAVVALLGRKEDDLSEREAFKIYGKAWIKDRTARGMLKFERSGPNEKNSKVYSRFEIEALKRSEKNIEESYKRALRSMEVLKQKSEK